MRQVARRKPQFPDEFHDPSPLFEGQELTPAQAAELQAARERIADLASRVEKARQEKAAILRKADRESRALSHRERNRERGREYYRRRKGVPPERWRPLGNRGRPVESDLGEHFPSARRAAELLGVSKTVIYLAIRKPRLQAADRHWKYEGDPSPADWGYIWFPINHGKRIQTNRGERFRTIGKAAKTLGVSRKYIQKALKHGWKVRGRDVWTLPEKEKLTAGPEPA